MESESGFSFAIASQPFKLSLTKIGLLMLMKLARKFISVQKIESFKQKLTTHKNHFLVTLLTTCEKLR